VGERKAGEIRMKTNEKKSGEKRHEDRTETRTSLVEKSRKKKQLWPMEGQGCGPLRL